MIDALFGFPQPYLWYTTRESAARDRPSELPENVLVIDDPSVTPHDMPLDLADGLRSSLPSPEKTRREPAWHCPLVKICKCLLSAV